jgi:hypothetical protein
LIEWVSDGIKEDNIGVVCGGNERTLYVML